MRVLIVEDHPDTADSLALALRLMGHHADGTPSAAGALELLQTGRYNCLAVDYFLGAVDGVQLLRRLRAQERYRGLPVLLMTAAGEDVVERMREEAAQLPPAAVITKPFYPAQFLDAMNRLRGEAADFRGVPGERPAGAAVAEGVGGPETDRPDPLRPGGPGAGAD